MVIFIVVYIFGKKSAKLCTGTQRYNLPVFLYSAFKNKLYSTFIQQKYLKQAPSYTVTFRNNRYLYFPKCNLYTTKNMSR